MSLKEMFDAMEDDCGPTSNVNFQWSAKGVGFGGFYFYTEDGKPQVYCANECMSKEFIKKMLCKMVDDCVLTEPSSKDEENDKN